MGCKSECFYGMGNICCIECPRYHTAECTDYCDELDAYTFTVNCPDYVKEETGGKVMDNYLVLNGKRIDLTEEQVKTLVGEEKAEKGDDPFRKPNKGKEYFYASSSGFVLSARWEDWEADEEMYKCANYCLDKGLMERRVAEETLSRLLWRFSMQNGGGKIDWNDDKKPKYRIVYRCGDKYFYTEENYQCRDMINCYFYDDQTAQRAIDEIIIPYVKEHPELGYEVEEQIEIPPLDINDAEDLDNEYEIKMED